MGRVVECAFDDALKARGLYANDDSQSAVKTSLSVTINRFEASQVVRREANVEFGIVLADKATGRPLWRDRKKVIRVDGNLIAVDTGIFASPDTLRAVALRAMSGAIDGLLDRPEFRAALR